MEAKRLTTAVRFLLACAFVVIWGNAALAHDLGDGAHLTTLFEKTSGDHENSDSQQQRIRWNLEITIQELVGQFPHYDIDENGKITPIEYGAIHAREVVNYVLPLLRIESDEANCPLGIDAFNIITHKRADYIQFPLNVDCPDPQYNLSVEYNLFFDQNPYHQGTWTVVYQNQPVIHYFWEDERSRRFQLKQWSGWEVFRDFVGHGIHHILIGVDHLLFLVTLLLPVVLIRRDNRWQPVASLKPAAINIAKVITVFTLAHSVTLTLAVLQWLPAPYPGLVESLIALTIVLMAVHNIRPLFNKEVLLITFGFGLIHGFGFANVLLEYPLSEQSLVLSLVAFNVGVEVGQLAIALLLCPLIFWYRQQNWYVRGVMPLASAAIGVTGLYWFFVRVFTWF